MSAPKNWNYFDTDQIWATVILINTIQYQIMHIRVIIINARR